MVFASPQVPHGNVTVMRRYVREIHDVRYVAANNTASFQVYIVVCACGQKWKNQTTSHSSFVMRRLFTRLGTIFRTFTTTTQCVICVATPTEILPNVRNANKSFAETAYCLNTARGGSEYA